MKIGYAQLSNGTPIKAIAERWNVSRTTIYRYIDKIEKTKTTTSS